MAQKYYNSAETAKLLGRSVDEIKKMLERRELHGYRDGADWKFKVEDIDALAKQQPKPAADEAGGDVLLSEVELGQSDPGLSGTVIGISEAGRPTPESDIRLADSDIQLGDSNPLPARRPFPASHSRQDAHRREEDRRLEALRGTGLDAGGGPDARGQHPGTGRQTARRRARGKRVGAARWSAARDSKTTSWSSAAAARGATSPSAATAASRWSIRPTADCRWKRR